MVAEISDGASGGHGAYARLLHAMPTNGSGHGAYARLLHAMPTTGSGHCAHAPTISSDTLAHIPAFAVAFLLSFPKGICWSLQPSQLQPRDHRERPRRARAAAACNALVVLPAGNLLFSSAFTTAIPRPPGAATARPRVCCMQCRPTGASPRARASAACNAIGLRRFVSVPSPVESARHPVAVT